MAARSNTRFDGFFGNISARGCRFRLAPFLPPGGELPARADAVLTVGYPRLARRADFPRRLGRVHEARGSDTEAPLLTENAVERKFSPLGCNRPD